MKFQVIFCVFVLVLICAAAAQCPNKPNGATCSDSEDCRSRLCQFQTCQDYNQVPDNANQPDPCRTHPCPSGKECMYRTQECFTEPCPNYSDCIVDRHCS